jgi:predicted dehydrogenase
MSDQKTLGFGMIGAGFGLSRCEIIQKTPGAKLAAVYSRSEEKAKAAAAQFGIRAYTDYRRLIEDPGVDVVGIYTPSGNHCEIAVEAARAGKHIIITKPPEINLERMDAMLAACKKTGVRFAVEFVVRYEEANYGIYSAIRDGSFGTLRLGEFSEKLHRLAAYFHSDGGWRANPGISGGGVLMNQGIHQLDQLLWMFGKVKSLNAITVQGRENPKAEETVVANLVFESGAVASLVATTTFMSDKPHSRYGGATIRRIEINGDQGSATLNGNRITMWVSKNGSGFVPKALPAENIFEDTIRWIGDVHYVSPTLVKGEEARYLLSVIHAIYDSAGKGGVNVTRF